MEDVPSRFKTFMVPLANVSRLPGGQRQLPPDISKVARWAEAAAAWY
jgi:hypothetical protein